VRPVVTVQVLTYLDRDNAQRLLVYPTRIRVYLNVAEVEKTRPP
jgi:hypothetical protein